MEDWKKNRIKYLCFAAVFIKTRNQIAKALMKKYGIWHKPEEEPDFSKGAICVVYEEQQGFRFFRNIDHSCNEDEWNIYKRICPIIKWAYRVDYLDVVTADYPL